MQHENIDTFIEFLYSVEESVSVLTADQVQKLQLIQTKVSEIVTKVNNMQATVNVPQQVPQLVAVSEKLVVDFKSFTDNNK